MSIFNWHVSPFGNIKYLILSRTMPLGSCLPLPWEFPSMLTPPLSHCLHILSVVDLWNFDQNNSWCKINPDRKKIDLLNVFIFPWLCKVSWSCFLKRFKTKLFSLLSLEYHWHKHWPFSCCLGKHSSSLELFLPWWLYFQATCLWIQRLFGLISSNNAHSSTRSFHGF